MKVHGFSSSLDRSAYAPGESNTRVHEARAAGLVKGSPGFILAIGGFLDSATDLKCGSELPTTLGTCNAPRSNGDLVVESPQALANEEMASWTLKDNLHKAIRCGIEFPDVNGEERHVDAKDEQRHDDHSVGSSCHWSFVSRELHQAPTSKGRGMIYHLCHLGSSSVSEERDGCSMSQSVDTTTTELYDTDHKRVDSMSSEPSKARTVCMVSSGVSATPRDQTTSDSQRVRRTSSEESASQRIRSANSETSGNLDGSDETTSDSYSTGSPATMHTKGRSNDSSLGAGANVDDSLGGMIQRTFDLTAETGVELLETLAERLYLFPIESSFDSTEDGVSQHELLVPRETRIEVFEPDDKASPQTPKWKKVFMTARIKSPFRKFKAPSVPEFKNTLRKVKPNAIFKVKSALQKVKLPKRHRIAQNRIVTDVTTTTTSETMTQWLSAVKRKLQRNKETSPSLVPPRSRKRVTRAHKEEKQDHWSIIPCASSMPEARPTSSAEPTTENIQSVPKKQTRDSKSRSANDNSSSLRESKTAQLQRLRTMMSRLSGKKGAGGEYGLAPQKLATEDGSKAVEKPKERITDNEHSFHLHSTTVSTMADNSAIDSAIEVILEDAPIPSLEMRRSNCVDDQMVEQVNDVDDRREAQVNDVLQPKLDDDPQEPGFDAQKTTTLATRKPDWLTRVERHGLLFLCKAIARGSMRVEMARATVFKGWFAPRKGYC